MTDKNKIYLAYGSNLNLQQMGHRCPYAVPIGTATLAGYRLMFRGSSNAVATVEPVTIEAVEAITYGPVEPQTDTGVSSTIPAGVPVLLWEITPRCEEALDRYEGWPRLYRKETVTVDFNGKPTEVMVYIMNEVYPYGQPGDYYLDVIKEGYASAGFDNAVLDEAIAASVSASGLTAKNCKLCGCKMVWENPHLPGHFHASSCDIKDWDICHDCMVDYCCSTNCYGCKLGKYPDCRFLEVKKNYMAEDKDDS